MVQFVILLQQMPVPIPLLETLSPLRLKNLLLNHREKYVKLFSKMLVRRFHYLEEVQAQEIQSSIKYVLLGKIFLSVPELIVLPEMQNWIKFPIYHIQLLKILLNMRLIKPWWKFNWRLQSNWFRKFLKEIYQLNQED